MTAADRGARSIHPDRQVPDEPEDEPLMRDLILAHEPMIRLGFFVAGLTVMALWEAVAPRRSTSLGRWARWPSNLGIVALNTAVVRLLLPTTAVALALVGEREGWGLLHHFALPGWLTLTLAVIALDLVVYLQHVMVHAVPALWRLHRVHHADLHFDVTTGARFPPIEILLSMLIKLAAILVIGPSPEAVVVFEVLLNATAMFNHGNVRLPAAVDRWLRWIVVTPDMHRVHHSVEDDETNSNFGFNLPWWDRLFGTYRDQPRGGHHGMTIGIRDWRDPRQVDRLPGMLALPFLGKVTDYAINRRQWAQPD
jgi:sterol desaturase/sphingolipid hydroxylase (fatty acid hydroxylase superfamily)